MGGKYVGAEVRRKEDPRLLAGRGQFVDDLAPAGCLHAVVLRSLHAHARIAAIRVEAARRHPAVRGVFTFEDLADRLKPLPTAGVAPPALQQRVGFRVRAAAQYPLARGVVRHVGEPVAILVAESRYAAEDALALIEVDYDPLPVICDVETGLAAGAPKIHPEWPDNVAVAFALTLGDPDSAFASAPVVVSERLSMQRYAGMPLEPRGLLAAPGSRGELTVWSSTQVPHSHQRALTEVLGLPAHRVRVIAPDVGGGFGTKVSIYPEDVLVPLLAQRLGRPVKWVETRREHLASATHSREQIHDVEIAATADGRILGLRDRFLLDQGAYNPWGIVQPYNTVGHLLGPFRVRNLAIEARSVVTNKTPHAPYRGAGRPEAVFAMDRIVDCLARRIGMDPAEIRRRNFVRAEEMPYDVGLLYRDGQPLVYDSGDFPATLEAALGAVGYDDFRKEQAGLRERGVHRGIGISSYVEGTGIGPYEGAVVRIDPSGRVVVATGACSQGQGHETVFAQIAADTLGVALEDVTVIGGDTAAIPFGIGTFASRSLVLAGNAVAQASRIVREKLLGAAAALLEAAPADLDIADGRVFVRGLPDRALPFARILQASLPTFSGAGVAEPDFEASAYPPVPTVTYASAVHVAVVECDPETGAVRLLRYVVAHDCGRVINPVIVDGQIHGGVVQGIGGALWENIDYDGAGQLMTQTLMEYHLPMADEVPPIETVHMEFPSPRNPLGVKGLGEGGAISPPAAIANAIDDALAPFGVRITRAAPSPATLWGQVLKCNIR
ncbi:MAG TPA: xanthine dehydrogenase family protein molybdopterin-binding subunit [Methylomirabilota bacterium]|nr:xanthine dehydrogenase family protein molybdopterin-binding subunit [Methylomirabilota bacterium]